MARPLSEDLYSVLACACPEKSPLLKVGDTVVCEKCGARHPIVDGVPVILDKARSVFDPERVILDYRNARSSRAERWARVLLRFVPSVGTNIAARKVSARMREMLAPIENPTVLVVGGGDVGAGLEELLNDSRYATVESDVYFGPRCNLIADGHDLPLKSESFDAVVCQAVLEHVVRPHACIAEMHRVLKPGGVIFIDVPFLFPVHMGAHDFTRFTLGGLRAACRGFKEHDAGISGGPGQAVGWLILYYFKALSSSRIWTAFVLFTVPWFVFWLRFVDYLLVRRPQASDVASGLFFLGTKSEHERSDTDILASHWTRRAPARPDGERKVDVPSPVATISRSR